MKILDTLKSLTAAIQSRGVDGKIVYRGETSRLMRAANSQISLNTTESGSKFFIEVQKGKRIANASVAAGADDLEEIRSAINTAVDALDVMPEIPFLTPPTAIAEHKPAVADYDAAVENIDSGIMKDYFLSLKNRFDAQPVNISGAFSCGMYEYGVADTLSAEPLYYKGSDFNIESVLQLAETKQEVRSSQVGGKLSAFKPETTADELERLLTLKQTTPREDIPPGEYDVVFGRDAIGELISLLEWLALSGEIYEFEMGMLQKAGYKLGDKVFNSLFSLVDAPESPWVLFHRPFGLNGAARGEFPLVQNGVLKNFYYSAKVDCDRFGVRVNNDQSVGDLYMDCGSGPATFDDMVRSCASPTLYIGYLHYTNSPNRAKGEFTGTSRFGTFLVENGAVKSHLYNLRLNDTLFKIFGAIDWLSAAEAQTNQSNTYGLRLASSIALPAFMKVRGVGITGSSKP